MLTLLLILFLVFIIYLFVRKVKRQRKVIELLRAELKRCEINEKPCKKDNGLLNWFRKG